MSYLVPIISFCFLFSFTSYSQDAAADSLLNELETTPNENLLPDRMLFTQRALWGENGLYRKMKIAPPLTAENRQRELKIRRNMFRIHQTVGLLTAAGMLTQGILGTKMYHFDFATQNFDDYEKIKSIHKGMATGINIGYATTALMAFTAPPVQVKRKGVSNIGVHKALSYIHLTGIITTNVLSKKINENPELKVYHRAAALTTFATFATAIAIIKFEF